MESMNHVVSITGFLVLGLTGSLGHCMGMCGPLILMVGARTRKGNRVVPLVSQLTYHGCRILVYTVFGVIAGVLGGALGLGTSLSHAAGIISLVLGIVVILFGFSYLGWLRPGTSRVSAGWWTRSINRALDKPGLSGVVVLGLLNGLLPCGLVYSALTASISTGNALVGGLDMLAFGLGTVPVLLVLGLGAHFISTSVRNVLSSIAFVLITAVGLQLFLRGLAALSIISHLSFGAIMLW